MVYCGKPSRACEQCKERKVKCSLKPNCRPCVKVGLVCSGPRDPSQLVFRDESVSIIQKETIRRCPRNPTVSIVDRARGFFISHYVVGNSRAFDYIPPLLERVNTDSHLSVSFEAVSLAHYFNKTRSGDILQKARHAYVDALRLTNAALQSNDLATRDSTMLAVLLLDLFEKIIKTAPRSTESWSKHINGALTLSKLRGVEQFSNPIGIRMFIQLSSTILISCVQRDMQPPAELIALRELASNYLDANDPKWQYSSLVMQFVGLRVAIKNGSQATIDIINSAKNIDADFQSILDHIPPLWKYDTINTSLNTNSEDIYEDHFHVFPDHRITHIWNNIRLSRILLNETILEQSKEVLSSSAQSTLLSTCLGQIQSSNAIIASLAADICASVPQYTRVRRLNKDNTTALNGVHQVLSEPASSFPTFNDSTSHSSASPRFFYYPTTEDGDQLYTPFEVARCYSLVFALYIAARSAASPERLKRWVISRLRFLSTAMGVMEAHMTAEVLEGKEDVNPWSVYAMLGSYSFSA